jgi:hypothetical protein
MPLRLLVGLGVIIAASKAEAVECRIVTRETFVQTIHPHGAVAMSQVNSGERYLVVGCAPEGPLVWCAILETERPAFTVRRFLQADRMAGPRSRVADLSECF